MPVRHGAAEGTGRGAHRVDMNPLVIARDCRELIDARLIDVEPVTGSQVLAHEGPQFRQFLIGVHRQMMARPRRRVLGLENPVSPPISVAERSISRSGGEKSDSGYLPEPERALGGRWVSGPKPVYI